MPSFEQGDLRKKEYIVLRDGDTGNVISVVFPNGIQIGVNNDSFPNPITITNLTVPPPITRNALYVVNGDLYYNGSILAIQGGANVTVKDEGVTLVTTLSSIDFVGSGITATASGNAVTVTTEVDGENQILASQVFG